MTDSEEGIPTVQGGSRVKCSCGAIFVIEDISAHIRNCLIANSDKVDEIKARLEKERLDAEKKKKQNERAKRSREKAKKNAAKKTAKGLEKNILLNVKELAKLANSTDHDDSMELNAEQGQDDMTVSDDLSVEIPGYVQMAKDLATGEKQAEERRQLKDQNVNVFCETSKKQKKKKKKGQKRKKSCPFVLDEAIDTSKNPPSDDDV